MLFFKRFLIIAALFLWGEATANDAREGAYKLNFEDDLSITLAALGMSGLGTFLYSRMDIPDHPKDKEDLLPWDRPLAGRYSKGADRASDIGAGLAIAPLVIGGYAWYGGHSSDAEFATFTLMFLQAIGIGNGINLAVRSLEIWPRPYMYAEDASAAEKRDNAKAEAYGSFFSGHATAAFTVATFTDQWFRTAYPNSPYRGIVTATAYSLAGLESVLRIAAGKHYVTDVIVGALVGTGVSLGILEMHKNRNKKFSVWAGPGVAGITFYH
mgnify:CR=1 FL=1